jgi:hypothetical protein
MATTDGRPDASLADFLHTRALSAAPRRLALDLIGGALVAAAALWARPAGWTVLASAGSCFSMFGLWAISERRLPTDSRDIPAHIEFGWLALRTSAAGLGVAALFAFLFALLGFALGTWIS